MGFHLQTAALRCVGRLRACASSSRHYTQTRSPRLRSSRQQKKLRGNYVVQQMKRCEIAAPTEPTEPTPIELKSSYVDPNADLNSGKMRAMAFGAQGDGSLGFFDFKATITSKTS